MSNEANNLKDQTVEIEKCVVHSDFYYTEVELEQLENDLLNLWYDGTSASYFI